MQQNFITLDEIFYSRILSRLDTFCHDRPCPWGKPKCRPLYYSYRAWQGPFQIIKQLSGATYRIQHTTKRRQRQVVHFDRLKPCNSDVHLHEAVQPVETTLESPVREQIPVRNADNLDVEEDVDDEAPTLLANEEEQSSRGDMALDIGIPGQPPEEDQVEDNMEAENTQGMPKTNIADSDCTSTPAEADDGAANPLEQRRSHLES